MIHTSIVGRLGADSELRQAPAGSVLNFRLAADHGFKDKKSTTWVRCAVWGKRGESLQKILTKGTQVVVRGELWTEERDGKVYVECRADEVELVGSKPQGQSGGGGGRASSDDDIPF